jgi:hypothetical protein
VLLPTLAGHCQYICLSAHAIEAYLCAKLSQASTLGADPESKEDDNCLCNSLLWESEEHAGGLREPCAGEADGILEVLRNAV